MTPLMLVSVIIFCLSLLLLVAYASREGNISPSQATDSSSCLSFSYQLSMQKHDYAFSFLFGAFAIAWFYKLATGKIVTNPLL